MLLTARTNTKSSGCLRRFESHGVGERVSRMGGGSEARALLREPMCVGFAADALGDVPSVDTCTLVEVCGFGAVTGDLLREVAEAGPASVSFREASPILQAVSVQKPCTSASILGTRLWAWDPEARTRARPMAKF